MGTLGQLVLTAIAAAVGTWFAAGWAFVQFRDQRAFERRMAWFDDAVLGSWKMTKALHDLTIAIDQNIAANAGTSGDTWQRVKDCFDGMTAAFRVLRETLGLKDLYAPDLDFESAFQEFDDASHEVGQSIGAGPHVLTVMRSSAHKQAEAMNRVHEIISAAARKHLESRPHWWRVWG